MTIKYDLTGFYNFREAGGMPAEGGRIRTERLLRCDFPGSLDQEDLEFLRDVPLSEVVDLRTEIEIHSAPRYFHQAGFNVRLRPISAGSLESMLAKSHSIDVMYQNMLRESPKKIAAAVTDVAEAIPNGAVLVHCTAGKDRTGVVVALIQSVLGVSDEDVVANYVLTQQNLEGPWIDEKIDQIRALTSMIPGGSKIHYDRLTVLMTQSPASAIQGVLDRVRDQHGSVEHFLLDNGVTPESLQALREALIEPDQEIV